MEQLGIGIELPFEWQCDKKTCKVVETFLEFIKTSEKFVKLIYEDQEPYGYHRTLQLVLIRGLFILPDVSITEYRQFLADPKIDEFQSLLDEYNLCDTKIKVKVIKY